MFNKYIIRTSIISVIIICLIITGIVMFRKLSYNKQVFETNLYDCLPLNVSGVLQINKEKEVQNLMPVFDSFKKITTSLRQAISYPLLFAEQKNSLYLLARVNDEQEDKVRDLLNNVLFASIPPKEVPYKNVKFLFYTTEDNQFFVCTFYAGVFIGGFNTLLLEDFVDIINKNALGIAQTPMGKEVTDKIKNHYPANLFLNNNGNFSVLNISLDNGKIKMEGVDTNSPPDNWTCTNITHPLKINYSIFPNSTVYYKADMEKAFVIDSLQCYFSLPSYYIQIKGKTSPLYVLKHTDNKFVIYNKLNKLEEGYIKKKFNIHDFFAGYRIYTTSPQMGQEIFNFDDSAYMVFYKDYLFFSEDKTVIQEYLLHNGNYEPAKYPDLSEPEDDYVSVTYSKDLKKYYPDYLNPGNPISKRYNTDVYIIHSLKNNIRNIEVFINN